MLTDEIIFMTKFLLMSYIYFTPKRDDVKQKNNIRLYHELSDTFPFGGKYILHGKYIPCVLPVF